MLRGQNPYLADEGVWARETGADDPLLAGEGLVHVYCMQPQNYNGMERRRT